MPVRASALDRDEKLLAQLRQQAAEHGRSAEAELGEAVRQALAGGGFDFDDLAAQMRALTAGRRHTPAEVLLRESRDER